MQSPKATGVSWRKEASGLSLGESATFVVGSRIDLEGPSNVCFREKVNLVRKGLFGCDPLSLTLHGNVRESIKPIERTRKDQRMW